MFFDNKRDINIVNMKTAQEIREIFTSFWKERGHVEISNTSLVPLNDPTLLFVNSGMFPLVPYLLGEKHPQGDRLCNFQKSIRVQDIEEVGNNRHTTFFEMMGNWSLGDYFKEEQIPWFLELYHERFDLDINRLYVSVFEGDNDAQLDEISIQAWKKAFANYGINAKVGETPADIYKNFDADGKLIDPQNVFKIFKFNKKENWWDRGSKVPGEPGGPDSEMFYDLGQEEELYEDKENGVATDNGRFIEIGNSVFMEYKLNQNLAWEKLEQQNVDFGGGFERVLMCIQGKTDVFATELFAGIINKLEEYTGQKFHEKAETGNTKYFRVIADHVRGAVFILAEGIIPGNKDQSYVLRRLIRRIVRHGRYLGLNNNFTRDLAEVVIDSYQGAHPHLEGNRSKIIEEIGKEEEKFRKTLERGLREFAKIADKGTVVGGEKAFWLYETYGFPIEMVVEELESRQGTMDEEEKQKLFKVFELSKKQHQDKSRAGAEKKFKGGLADQSLETMRLHTAHHLLLAALQQVLGDHVHQRGSNITAERLRIDFSHNGKLTLEQVVDVEKIVNQKIQQGWYILKKTLQKDLAVKLGAEMEFGVKYGEMVNIYFVVNPDLNLDQQNPEVEAIPADKIFSKEFCGGPHVGNTADIAGTFKIKKQESVGAGMRRIKAVLD